MVAGDVPPAVDHPGFGSGHVTVEANLIQSNASNDDGGGIRLLKPLDARVDIINNMIVNNLAADTGGGLALDDASNVFIINNTIAVNVSTSTAEDAVIAAAGGPCVSCTTVPSVGGLSAHTHSDAFNPADGSTFSDPVMFNNLFWDNQAFWWGFDAAEGIYNIQGENNLVDMGVFPDEAPGTGNCLDPNNSILSVTYGDDGASCDTDAGIANIIGQDPLLVSPWTTDFLALPNALNPNAIFVQMQRLEGTLVGFSDYHVPANSPAFDAGADIDPAGSGEPAPCDDFDHDGRPNNGLWDIGADEQPGAPVDPACSGATPTNAAPVVNAGPDQGIDTPTLPIQVSLDGTATDDGNIAPLTYEWTLIGSPAGSIVTIDTPLAEDTTVTLSDEGDYTFRLTVFDGEFTASDDVIVEVVFTGGGGFIPPADVYLSVVRNNRNFGGLIGVDDEDIVGCDLATGTCTLIFDGSSVGIGGTDITAVDVVDLPFGEGSGFLIVLESATTLPGLGTVTPWDVILFTPTDVGPATTAGSFSMYLDGSDVLLTTNGERIDAIHAIENGLFISTRGNARVRANPGETNAGSVRARDEDLLRYTPTTNTWSLYFDGSDVALGAGSEDVDGASITENGDIYLTTRGSFNVGGGVSGPDEDIFTCVSPTLTPGTTGGNTTSSCAEYSLFLDSSAILSLGNDIDGFALGQGAN
jgi:hypothetical protein